MNQKSYALIGTAGPALLLAGALALQHIDNLVPCELCIWQRWPHLAAMAFGFGFLLSGNRAFAILAITALVAGSGVAFFHVGVEQNWWAGLSSCSGVGLAEMTGRELLDFSQAENIARCDDVAWSMLGLSMAAWNGLLSLCIATSWCLAITTRNPTRA
ncbi:MAG: disulfide bond formation protein B [Rhodobacteraceae bacterium]|nr:disulfide bond formation protein B [Paracoccaceae bacterium]